MQSSFTSIDTCRYEVVGSGEYISCVVAAITHAARRVVLLALLVSYDEETRPLFAALHSALARGVTVRVVLDEYYVQTYFVGRLSRLWQTMTALKQLEDAGATVTRLTATSVNPFRGRCHTKFTVIDSVVYSFGGVNLADKAAANNDYMLRLDNAHLADALCLQAKAVESGKRQPDVSLKLDGTSTVLIDGGEAGASLIYSAACEMVQRSCRVLYVSQFCPTGPLVRHLRATDSRLYFNRSLASPPHIGAMLSVDKTIGRVRTAYRGDTYLHAKLILAELHDGSRALITGSHNFKWQGVKYGTAEIALYSEDPVLWKQLYAYFTDSVEVSKWADY